MKKWLALIFWAVAITTVYADEGTQHGAYGLLAVGRGYNNFSADNFTASPSFSNERWVLAGRVAAGYNIDKYIGVELGGRYFNRRKFLNIANTSYTGYVNEQAYTAQTVIRWPFADGYNVFVKFGPALVFADLTSSATDAQENANTIKTPEIKEWEPVYSLGASMTLNDFPGVSLMIEYSAIKEDKDRLLPKSELYVFGFMFHF